MSLQNSAVLVDGTVATTGGTSTTFKTKGNTLLQHDLLLDDGSPLVGRTDLSCSIKAPKVSVAAPNGYTQARNTMILKVPLLLDNGSYTVNTIKVEMAVDIETTDAERDTMRITAAQLLHASAYDDFWNLQSLD